jgi:hypothetical protein
VPAHARLNGSDSHAAGRARQHLKLAAIGYASARHGLDASVEKARAGLAFLCQKAIEFVEILSGVSLKNRRVDLSQGDSEMLAIAGIAYAHARHGIDADVGMAREGLAMLCQASINYVESLPKEDPLKRSSNSHLQIGNGA